MFIELNPELELKLKNIKTISLKKGILQKSFNNKMFSDNYLAFTMGLTYYGIKLHYDLNHNGSIQKIYYNNETLFDFSSLSEEVNNVNINIKKNILTL